MTFLQPGRPGPRRARSAVVVVGFACLALLLAVTAFAAARHPLSGARAGFTSTVSALQAQAQAQDAARVAGSETRFLADMNAEARALGMDHTTYTDPSGFDPARVSIAADQVRVFQRAMRFSVFRQMVSMTGLMSTEVTTLPEKT